MRVGIVGGGINGLCLAWALRKAGVCVAVFDRAAIPVSGVPSAGRVRIVREPLHGHPADGDPAFAPAMFEAWAAVWRDLGECHYEDTGVHQFLSDPPPGPASGSGAVETHVLKGGVLRAGEILRAVKRWLAENDVVFFEDSPVVAVDPGDGALTLDDGSRHRFPLVICAAGEGNTRLHPAAARGFAVFSTVVVTGALECSASACAPGIDTAAGDGLYFVPDSAADRLVVGIAAMRWPGRSRALVARVEHRIKQEFRSRYPDFGSLSATSHEYFRYVFANGTVPPVLRDGKVVLVNLCDGKGFRFGPRCAQLVADTLLRGGDEEALNRSLRRARGAPLNG